MRATTMSMASTVTILLMRKALTMRLVIIITTTMSKALSSDLTSLSARPSWRIF